MILSSRHAFAKGVLVSPDQLHVSYVHSPIRFAWDLQQYYLDSFGWTLRRTVCGSEGRARTPPSEAPVQGQ